MNAFLRKNFYFDLKTIKNVGLLPNLLVFRYCSRCAVELTSCLMFDFPFLIHDFRFVRFFVLRSLFLNLSFGSLVPEMVNS